MFANQLIILIYATRDVRAALGCEAHCGNCPFKGLNETCPGRVLQKYIDDAKKRIEEG